MASPCSFDEDNCHKVWHDYIGHVILLTSVQASHDTDGIVNGTVLFARLRWLKHDVTWHCWHHQSTTAYVSSKWSKSDATLLFQSFHTVDTASIMWCNGIIISTTVFISQMNWINVQHNFFGHVMPLMLISKSCDANSVTNGIILFVSQDDQMRCNMTLDFWSCDTIGITINIMWCQWHQQWNKCISLVEIMKWGNITFLVMLCHWCWYQCHMIPTVSSVAPFHLFGQGDQKEMQYDFFLTWGHWHQYHVISILNGCSPTHHSN